MRHATIKHYEARIRRDSLGEASEEYRAAINSPDQVVTAARALIGDAARESFLVFHLDVKHQILGYSTAATGASESCPVDPREVFRLAVSLGASAVIVAHNHPSGDPTPSTEDRTITGRLARCGDLLGIKLLDHVIVAGDKHYSLAKEGEL